VLGVVEVDDHSFVMADIPGIIEGAHEGAGLGLTFLRHVQRTRVLVHVVDSSGASGRDALADFHAVREEARLWDPHLLEKPQLLAATKRDAVQGQDDPLPELRRVAAELGVPVVPVSAVTGLGLTELRRAVWAHLAPSVASPSLLGSNA
jgi:GTP-binding protein